MDFKYRSILQDDSQLGPYPLEKLKRVNAPTNMRIGDTKQRSMGDTAFSRALRGEYGTPVQERTKVFYRREPILAQMRNLQMHIAGFELPEIAPEKAPVPDDPRIMSRHLKMLGYFLGADMVGICRVPEAAMYSETADGKPLEKRWKNAVVLLNIKHQKTIAGSFGREWIDDPVSFQVYQLCATQGLNMAGYIRNLGWDADASAVGRYTTLITPLLIESGLGEVSRMGIAVNPFAGASFKASAVLTDLELEPDGPVDFGLQEYCSKCKICAEQCPMRALSDGDKVLYNGYETWRHNYRSCITGIMTNKVGNFCERCTKVCPWLPGDTTPEQYADWDGDPRFLHKLADKRATELRESNFIGPQEKTGKWWFPLMREGDSYVEAPEYDYAELEERMQRLEQCKSEGKPWYVPMKD